MRRYLGRSVTAAAIAAIFLLGSGSIGRLSQRLVAQAPQPERMPGPIIVDPPGPYQGHSYVPAPPTNNLTDGSNLLSTFQVTYSGFTPEAQAAFQAAVDVWANIVQSPVPIRVNANWTVLGSNVLGSAGSHFVFRNFTGGVASTWYPDALADRLSGSDLSPGTPDIDANFNSNFTWYYGTDGNITTPSTYDLMSVVLHELGHGLGFFGSMSGASGVTGTWGQSSQVNPTVSPYIYDRFAINGTSQFLIDTTLFANPSATLYSLLTGDSIFFGGPSARAAFNGNAAPLYAPASWSSGSSYSHLREGTFTAGNPNSLMTPQIGAAESIHNPGPITKGIFADMGWNSSALTANPGSLLFGATKNGAAGDLVTTTPAQQVAVTFATQSSAWTATANVPWVQVTNGSGTGAGQFTVAIINPGNVLGASTSVTATVTVTAATLGATFAIPLKLNIQLTPATSAPAFGSFDSPANNAANVVGAIAVTGWALDDVGVQKVEIWRDCIEAIDRALGACTSSAPGQAPNFVFIGTAAFLPGARPDVETANATIPQSYKAGWGYLMSTNAFPHVPAPAAPQGGQGTFTLTAYAVDVEQHYTLLGTKVITLTNDAATIPFGSIDTPDQGGTVTVSVFASFGWGMTQSPKCIDPTKTTSYKVYIDGVSRTLTPGVNWFPGLTRPDIAAAYPGRCNTNNALAAYYIDSTALALTNGLHTTGWDLIDDATKVAGIGSRFFNVLIGSSVTTAPPDLKVGPMSSTSRRRRDADRPAVLGHASDLMWLAPAARNVSLQLGGDEAPLTTLTPGTSGRYGVQFGAASRMALDLDGPVTAGYQQVGSELRALPAGSTLDADAGIFAWQPPAPFLGPFQLVFLGDNTRIDVTATIVDRTLQSGVEMNIDLPARDSGVGSSFIVAGWALDPLAASGSGVDTLHVWAYRRDGVAAPQFLGAAAMGGLRPDIAALKGEQFERTGFSLTTPALAPGVYDILVYPWSHRLGAFQEAQSVRVTVR